MLLELVNNLVYSSNNTKSKAEYYSDKKIILKGRWFFNQKPKGKKKVKEKPSLINGISD